MRKRRLRGRKLKKQRRIIIASVLALTLLLSTGYAAFSTNISLSAKGNIKENEKTASETIIENETVQESTSTLDGLYQDTYEEPVDGKYRYIYKGTDPNNYIEFNDEVWRIYSIEPDGSIKITRSDLLASRIFDPNSSNNRLNSGYCSQGDAPSYGCNAWASTASLNNSVSSFVNGRYAGAVSADSALNTYLNGTYYSSLSSTAQGQIVTHDWNVGPAGAANDTYTLSQLVSTDYEAKYKWNGKVALLTKSEYMRASSNSSCVTASYWYDNQSSTTCEGSDYLYNSSKSWWLLSPISNFSNYVLSALNGGRIYYYNALTSVGVRPALYLSPDITITGEGTNDSNIYKIS